MPRPPRSPNAHGRSEVWTRPAICRAAEDERGRLGAALRTFRKKLGWTQERAAEEIGIHTIHLVRIERGLANVTLTTLVAISCAYGISLRRMF